jgi:hypothetical protein
LFVQYIQIRSVLRWLEKKIVVIFHDQGYVGYLHRITAVLGIVLQTEVLFATLIIISFMLDQFL